jgi:hypothetical protein
VVTETDSHTSGCARRSSATTVDLPTPDGPERTVSRLFPGGRKPTFAPDPTASWALASPDQDLSVTSYPPLNLRFSVEQRLALVATELALEGGPLVRAETPHAAGLGDGKPLHELLGADLAHAGE